MYEVERRPVVIEPTSMSLLLSAAAGDYKALRSVCDIYYPLVYGWCRMLGANAEDAEDISQNVFKSIGERIEKYDATKARFRRWLYSVTQHLTFDTWRKRGNVFPNSELVEDLAAPASAVSEVPPRSIQIRMLKAMEQLLSSADRDILYAVIVYARPMAEVAEDLGISVSNGYVRKSRALKVLRESLAGLEDEFLSNL